MRRFVVLVLVTVCMVGASGAGVRADETSDALNDLATQLRQMRSELDTLRQENQRLQALVAEQPAPQPAPQQNTFDVMAPGGSATPANLFEEPVRIYHRPGARPPSWLDMLIEQNRMRTMESWARARANERLADERLLRIAAESRAMGTGYAPRPLRDAVLAGGDPKQHRDRLVAARSSDFDLLFGQPQVREYLQFKAARLSGDLDGGAPSAAPYAGIAPATVRYLTDRMRRNLEDATILYGRAGLNGPAPAGYGVAESLTRRLRDSSNPLISGPTRDTIGIGRRMAAVDVAVAEDLDIELVTRMHQIREANRRLAALGYAPTAQHIAEDLAQINNVLNGKISRTRVPEVHAIENFEPPQN